MNNRTTHSDEHMYACAASAVVWNSPKHTFSNRKTVFYVNTAARPCKRSSSSSKQQ